MASPLMICAFSPEAPATKKANANKKMIFFQHGFSLTFENAKVED